MRKLIMLSFALLTLTGFIYWTMVHPQNQPVASDYEMALNVSQASSINSEDSANTPLTVAITKWNQNYDKSRYEVFFVVTTSTESVLGLTTTSTKVITGGWYAPDVENSVLERQNLAPLPVQTGQSSWSNVTGNAPLKLHFTATTSRPVAPRNWRIVVFALDKHSDSVSLLWSRVIRPQ